MSRVHQQRGVALLVVLILLVMMSALAAKISQQFCRNLQKTHYQVSQQQLRWAMQAQEKVVKDRLQNDASGESKPLDPEGDWHLPLETQGEDYTVVSQVDDAQDCFNVNNLLAADKVAQDQNASTVPEKPRKEKIVEQILTDGGNHIQLDLSGIDLSQYSALHIRADAEGRGYLFLAVQSDYLRDHAFPATSGPICLTLWTMREKNAYLSGVQFGSGVPFLSGFNTKVGDLKRISIFCKDYSSGTVTRGKLSLYGEA